MSIEVEALSYTYMPGTPYQRTALEDVNVVISEGDFVAIIGPTGSGKSTLVQHLNGLLKPQRGRIKVDGQDIWEKGFKRSKVRYKVGLVFQYPEHQLFEETVYKDIAFGPRSIGMDQGAIDRQVRWAMETVGLDYDELRDLSPFDLSGGQRRRIAIAGVLAMGPKYLVLDEPTAGLDPKGRREIMDHIYRLYKKRGITIILVSHDMDEVARLARRIVVMEKGKVSLQGTPAEVFDTGQGIRNKGLALPTITSLMFRLRDSGWPVRCNVFDIDDAKKEILRVLRSNDNA
jgi:energy-coupling factor transport system ATP-binding protein